jgi:hypothetical protein
MLREIGPLVQRYIPSAFSGPGERTFEEFVTDLDKALDSKDPHSGTHDIGDTLVTLDVTAPSAYLFAWNKAPLDRKDAAYANLSRALQAKLKELVTFYYFSDPSRYATPAAAAPAIVFSCMPPTTTIKLNGDNEVAEFNTDKDYHWDQTEPKEISAVATARPTVDAVAKRLQAISDTLRGIPELAGSARFYNPDQVDDIIHAALTRTFPSSPRPELLGSLLDLEVQLIKSAAATGIELARFRQTAGTNPAEALKHLAQFGEDLAKTFNEVLGHHPFLSGASRPLGTLLFLEAAASFDPAVRTISVDSLMNITVIQSGKLSLDDMLSGKIKDENVLFEQPLLQSN